MAKNQSVTTTEVGLSHKADKIIKNHVLIAMGFGAVPIPLVDIAGITATQVSMISKLSGLYDVQFSNELGKSLVGSLIGSVGGQTLATGTFGSLIKAIPGIGSIIGAVTYPAIAGTTTYAVGKVFERHFETGGTLLDFKVSDAKHFFHEELEKGKHVVDSIKKPFTKKEEVIVVEE